MSCCCFATKSRAYILFTFSIWIEVRCGFVATLWFGFFDNYNPYYHDQKDVLDYVIFVLDTGIGLWLLCFTLIKISSRIKKSSIQSPKVNELFALSTIVTFSVFFITFCHKNGLSQHRKNEIDHIYFIFIGTVYLLPLMYLILSTAPVFKKMFPFIVFLIWIQMGIGLVVTNVGTAIPIFGPIKRIPDAWTYAIFSVDLAFASVLFLYTGNKPCSQPQQNIFKKPVVKYWVCKVSTVATSAAYGLIWAQNALILWEYGIPKLVTNVLGIYIYSVYLLTLLQCKPDRVEENTIRDGIVMTAVRIV